MKKLLLTSALAVLCAFCVQMNASADIFNTINNIGGAVHSINSAARGTMSTYEYGNRFLDRRQERLDRKRAEKSYSDDAEAEYYRTLQETQKLKNQNNNMNYEL